MPGDDREHDGRPFEVLDVDSIEPGIEDPFRRLVSIGTPVRTRRTSIL
jgi:hypothetical protein